MAMPEAKTKARRVFIQRFVMTRARIMKKRKMAVENAEQNKSLYLLVIFSLKKDSG
jgi:hypothetical protein